MKNWILFFILILAVSAFANQRVVVLEEFTSGT